MKFAGRESVVIMQVVTKERSEARERLQGWMGYKSFPSMVENVVVNAEQQDKEAIED